MTIQIIISINFDTSFSSYNSNIISIYKYLHFKIKLNFAKLLYIEQEY